MYPIFLKVLDFHATRQHSDIHLFIENMSDMDCLKGKNYVSSLNTISKMCVNLRSN